MTLSSRDSHIVRFLSIFQQLTFQQINELCFDSPSRTPADRALKRLIKQEYVARVEMRRLIGGSKGGAGQYAYHLGRRGYHLMFDKGAYRLHRNVRYHQMLLADVYILIRKLEAATILKIDGFTTEADQVGEYEVRHDMRIDVTRRDGERFMLWVEVDMATEGRKQIADKLVRMRNAIYSRTDWPVTPHVVWVACDAERAKELNWIIDQGKDDASKQCFTVTTLEHLSAFFMS